MAKLTVELALQGIERVQETLDKAFKNVNVKMKQPKLDDKTQQKVNKLNLRMEKLDDRFKKYNDTQSKLQQQYDNTTKKNTDKLQKLTDKIAGIGRKKGLIETEKGIVQKDIDIAMTGGKGGGLMKGLKGAGIIGAIIGIASSLKSVKFVLDVIAGVLNALIAPLVPILLTLFKPFLLLFVMLGALMFKFFQDPIEALKDLGDIIVDGLKSLIGLNGKDKQKSAVGTVGAVGGAGIGFAAGGPWGAAIGAALGPVILGFAASIGEWLGTLMGEFTIWLDKLSNGAVGEFIQGFIDFFVGLWNIFAGLFTLDWNKFVSGFISVIDGLWNILTGQLRIALSIFWRITFWLWDKMKEVLKSAFDWLINSNLGNWIWTSITNVLSTSFQALTGIGSWIKNKIQDAWDGIKSRTSGFLDKGKDYISRGIDYFMNDGIITPSGQIVRTAPNDYIMAMKRPQDLGKGNGGNNITINLTVNGKADKSMIDTITRELRKQLSQRGAF